METSLENSYNRLSEADEYNRAGIIPGILVKDANTIPHPDCLAPGEPATDFVLRDTKGKSWKLAGLKGKPVVLIIGSGTCPVTEAYLPDLKRLNGKYAKSCHWLFLYVREAFPDEKICPHKSYEQKRDQAEQYRQLDEIPWPILVDSIDGEVHRKYGLLPSSVLVIDSEGRITLVSDMASVKTVAAALEHLSEQGMHGVVPESFGQAPHMLDASAYGWEADDGEQTSA